MCESRGGRSEAEAVAHSEVANEAPTPAEAASIRAIEAAFRGESLPLNESRAREIVKTVFDAAEEPAADPLEKAFEDYAAEESKKFHRDALVKLARRGESLAVGLAQFDPEHAEEVMGCFGALIDSCEQGKGAVVPMVTQRARRLRNQLSVIQRGAARLEEETAKLVERANAAETRLIAARETMDSQTRTIKDIARERDAKAAECVRLRQQREHFDGEARAAEKERDTALSRVAELEGLLRELMRSSAKECPPDELLERIGKAVL